MMNYKTLVAAALTSISLSAPAFAQCTDNSCARDPNRDPLTGVETPAGKMGLERPGGAASANTANNAYARVRDHHLQAPRKTPGPPIHYRPAPYNDYNEPYFGASQGYAPGEKEQFLDSVREGG